MELNGAQRQAVEAGDGALLIVAPPGSGKTHTLSERIAHLIEKRDAAPERILTLTFTNKAANEIRERIVRRGGFAAAPHASTFHALALEMLRQDGGAIGIAPDFAIVEDEKDKTEHSLTFDELLTHALKLLEGSATVRKQWQNRFDHILVDEYQDTDDRQEKIISILAQKHGNICAIGDPNQSIYGFRGANVENFHSFNPRYGGARIDLRVNYRSTPLLVNAAAGMVRGETPSAFRREPGEKIVLKECASPKSEARWIARQIEKLIGGTDHGGAVGEYQPGDIAVLYRLHALGKPLEEALMQAGIPYVLVNEENIDEIEFDTYRVPLMTMHAAKGLEFPVVFIAGLEDGVVPYLKDELQQGPSLLEEERRLLYVAMTRAKDRLFLSRSRARVLFGKPCNEPSRFLRDIPRECVEIEEREASKALQKRLF